jgi:hypothetical protein
VARRLICWFDRQKRDAFAFDMINPFGAPFSWAVREYVAHYHLERNHQGLGNALTDGVLARPARFLADSCYGGLLNH